MGLEQVIERGTRFDIYHPTGVSNIVRCADGFVVSVVAGGRSMSEPRLRGPFTRVEVGFPSQRPEPWSEWSVYAPVDVEPTEAIYAFVPVEMVRALVESHGGEEVP